MKGKTKKPGKTICAAVATVSTMLMITNIADAMDNFDQDAFNKDLDALLVTIEKHDKMGDPYAKHQQLLKIINELVNILKTHFGLPQDKLDEIEAALQYLSLETIPNAP
ncbi:MAG: hypothetical protein ACJ8C4_06665 [Gemmataceae bacterium]